MKTIFILLAFLAGELLHAQDTTLPSGNSRIHLYSGKEIKHIRLWKIDSAKVEYVMDGNLTDVKIAEVKKIETPDYLITFGEGKKILKRNYDLIVPYYGDTIRCIIHSSISDVISYIPIGSESEKFITKSSVKFYMQWPEEKPEVKKTVPEIKKDNPETSSALKDSVKTMQMPTAIAFGNPKTDSTDKKKETIPAPTNKQEYISKKDAEREVADWQYYHQSYQRGVSDAEKKPDGGWTVGGFCLGASGCFPLLSMSAVNSNVNVKAPPGVDQKLYEEGYKNQTKQKRVKSASTGGLVALGILSFLTLIIVASGQ